MRCTYLVSMVKVFLLTNEFNTCPKASSCPTFSAEINRNHCKSEQTHTQLWPEQQLMIWYLFIIDPWWHGYGFCIALWSKEYTWILHLQIYTGEFYQGLYVVSFTDWFYNSHGWQQKPKDFLFPPDSLPFSCPNPLNTGRHESSGRSIALKASSAVQSFVIVGLRSLITRDLRMWVLTKR